MRIGSCPSLRRLTTALGTRADSSTRVGFTVNWLAPAGDAASSRPRGSPHPKVRKYPVISAVLTSPLAYRRLGGVPVVWPGTDFRPPAKVRPPCRADAPARGTLNDVTLERDRRDDGVAVAADRNVLARR